MPARIADILRFSTHDGPGIRTTVFLKGCPLSCVWCHNPETISTAAEIGYVPKKCVGCGECVRVCPESAHRIEDGRHVFDRALCVACGACAEVCLGEALTLYGREMSADEVLDTVLRDRAFYERTGGGLTLSGGEPLLQVSFCAELLVLAKREGIHTAVDTCGAVPWGAFEQVLPLTDLFLYDLKHTDPVVHRRFTGADNALVLRNLRGLAESGAAIEIRIPIVPGVNDDDAFRSAADDLLGGLAGISAVKRLPFNPCARSKYEAVGREIDPLHRARP
ncbi:MAG: glycyl-radical enzyme activating protein [Armatimonadota bacterium]|jgi:glycyl-radical enzyme activating protein